MKMNKRFGTLKDASDKLVRSIKRKTRKHYSVEQKIRIVLADRRHGASSDGALGQDAAIGICSLEFGY